jgi:hypothetical protein
VLIQDPTSFIVRQECDQLTHRNGFRLPQEEADGWRRYESTTAQGSVWLAAAGSDGPWFLALDHPGVIAELKLPPDEMPGPGLSRYQFADLGMLYEVMPLSWRSVFPMPRCRSFSTGYRTCPGRRKPSGWWFNESGRTFSGIA